MEAHEAMEQFERAEELSEARERFGRHAAVLVAVLAALLALASLESNNASKDTILEQAKATDAFNELEANSLKKHINDTQASVLAALAAGPQRRAAATLAATLEKKVAEKYGPNESALLPRAQASERKSANAETRHKLFEYAVAAFQIAIVLTSVAIVARATALTFVAGLLGLAGIALMLGGLTTVLNG